MNESLGLETGIMNYDGVWELVLIEIEDTFDVDSGGLWDSLASLNRQAALLMCYLVFAFSLLFLEKS